MPDHRFNLDALNRIAAIADAMWASEQARQANDTTSTAALDKLDQVIALLTEIRDGQGATTNNDNDVVDVL